ncbi:hypothetical protein [Mucilaginibacter flavus]|uniref:hypothetical protein n=1 Tax=Mucilaginibacter flavus TaxID=931504 RepID=UPI0025B2D9B8|nr:hypothetical protein [Mucilaginibacter flavus]MDN3582761.1 hypothetical protein [Mucilaginibacter flavus]
MRGKLRVKIPTQLTDVSLGQMMAMQTKTNLTDIEAISILSGIAIDELQQVKDVSDFHAFGDAVLALSYQIKYLYNSDAIPKQVNFSLPKSNRTKTVKVMQNLAIEPAGAFMAVREIIADEVNNHIKQVGEDNWQESFNPSLNTCCQVLAHYFFCKATGKKYNEYEVEEFMSQVKNMRVTEALPIAKHFFTCYPSLSIPKTSFWLRLQRLWKNGPASSRSRNLSTSTP